MTKVKAIGNYATADGHFKQSLVEWAAQGNDTSTINAQHLAECEECQARVNEASAEFVLMQASLPPDGTGLPEHKKRVNKMGRSSRGYMASIAKGVV